MAKVENEQIVKDYEELSVANFYAFDKVNGLEYYSGTLESHELAKTMEQEEIKGGQDNATICTIDKKTEIKLTIGDVVARQDIQALKLGGKITKVEASDNVYAFHMPKNYEVGGTDGALTFSLSQLPKDGEEVAIYNNKTKKKLTPDTDYTIEGKEVTIKASDVIKGDTVFVTGFYYKAPETDSYVEIKEGSVPEMLTVIEVPLYGTDTQIKAYKQYIFPRTRMSSSVTLKGQTEKTKNTDSTEITILKDSSLNYLGRIIYRSAE